jgi:hypothetical protein
MLGEDHLPTDRNVEHSALAADERRVDLQLP